MVREQQNARLTIESAREDNFDISIKVSTLINKFSKIFVFLLLVE
jgi:hypothetical protein